MRHITILSFSGGLAATVIAPFDVLRMAGLAWRTAGLVGQPLCRVELATMDGKPVHCGNRFTVTPHLNLAQAERIPTDLLLVSSPGPDIISFMERHPDLLASIRRFYEQGTTIASVCAGTFLLAEAGILDGRIATTHWAESPIFQARYPRVLLKPERLITDNGNLICAGGAYSAIDLALYLVEKYFGRGFALMCSESLILETGRTSQAPFALFDFQKQHGDDKVLAAQQWLEQHFQKSFLLKELANAHGMSPRNFSRRFKRATGDTPLVYQRRLRIAAASKLLEGEFTSIEETCFQVGYEDVDFFRSLFKRYMGETPAAYRLKCRKQPAPLSANDRLVGAAHRAPPF